MTIENVKSKDLIVEERFEKIEAVILKMAERMELLEKTIEKTLESVIKAEQLNQLNVTSVLKKTFDSIAHGLEHSLEAMRHHVSMSNAKYKIEIVDGENERQTDNTVAVTKIEEGFVYAKASDPDMIIDKKLDIFNEYFEARPELFEKNKTINVNIYTEKQESTND